ncbi:MAG: molybdate ABC transporter substrate-binding protein [Spirochaetales bacterium]|nr:molybdate ABC transporter substrate-binding protein [Spirochaetales bacterium]
MGNQEGSDNPTDPLIVFAAASTIDVMQSLADQFEEETGRPVLLNPASSGTLAKQLAQGAQADIFISASKKWMDYADEQGLVAASIPFAGNRMVLIAPADSSDEPVSIDSGFDLPGSFEGRFSMGDPAHVPAGAYGKEALEFFGWYTVLEPRILPAANVRAALSVVELGESERGIVYRTDALKSDKVRILGEFPAESHSPVSYFAALLKDTGSPGEEFYDFIVKGSGTGAILEEYGFEMKIP